MNECRNCGASTLQDLGFIGTLAPFFLKRVLRAEVVVRKSIYPRKRAIQRLTDWAQRIVSRVHPPATAVELQSCVTCSFVQTTYPFPEEGISRLYADYRSDSYNRERTHYEPHYASIAGQVGSHLEAGVGRVEALTAWLSDKVHRSGFTMLDFGGADGKFLPDLPGERFVYEISDIPPANGVTRIADEASLGSYGYVQLSHVLEHVTQPLHMVLQVSTFVEPGGYLLIEVPQDVDTELLTQLQGGYTDLSITIHEHINLYSPPAVQKLLEATGFEVVALEAIAVETPLKKQFFVRGLAKRPLEQSLHRPESSTIL